jgi:hypothetical protein
LYSTARIAPAWSAQEVRVETAIGLLQEERTALAPNQVAHPELDASLLRLNVQPTGTLEFLLAVEVADAPIEMLAEVEAPETAVVITTGRVGLGVELEGVLVGDRDACDRILSEQRLLVGLGGENCHALSPQRLKWMKPDESLPADRCAPKLGLEAEQRVNHYIVINAGGPLGIPGALFAVTSLSS